MLAIFIGMLDTKEEKDKLEQIYERYYGTMLAVAKGIIAGHALAEDAVSDAILKVIKNLQKITDVSSHKTKAYIVIIVRSSAIDLLRKQKSYREVSIVDNYELLDNSASLSDIFTMKESYDIIVKHIRALPNPLSDVLYLSAVFGHSTEEISELLNISKDNVRQRLSRAKSQVRITLEQEGIEYAEK